MALEQNEWTALYLFSFIIAFPYLVEFVRIYLLYTSFRYSIKTNGSGGANKSTVKIISWLDYLAYSRNWYSFVQTRVWAAPPLWSFPLAWVCVTVTHTASTFWTWQHPQYFSTGAYNAILAFIFPHVFFTTLWVPSFFRMRSSRFAMFSSIVIAILAIVSIVVQGANATKAGFYLYFPFTLWWIYVAWLSSETYRVSVRSRSEDFDYSDPYDPQQHGEAFQSTFSGGMESSAAAVPKHGWSLVDDKHNFISESSGGGSGSGG